jgi:hypothetical protein
MFKHRRQGSATTLAPGEYCTNRFTMEAWARNNVRGTVNDELKSFCPYFRAHRSSFIIHRFLSFPPESVEQERG